MYELLNTLNLFTNRWLHFYLWKRLLF